MLRLCGDWSAVQVDRFRTGSCGNGQKISMSASAQTCMLVNRTKLPYAVCSFASYSEAARAIRPVSRLSSLPFVLSIEPVVESDLFVVAASRDTHTGVCTFRSSAKHSFVYVWTGIKPVSSHWRPDVLAGFVRRHLTAVTSSEASLPLRSYRGRAVVGLGHLYDREYPTPKGQHPLRSLIATAAAASVR